MMGYIERFNIATMAPDPATDVGGTNGIGVTVAGGLAWVTGELTRAMITAPIRSPAMSWPASACPILAQDDVLAVSGRYLYYGSPAAPRLLPQARSQFPRPAG